MPAGDTTRLQIYRAPVGDTLDRAAHAVGRPVLVSAGITSSIVDGDATRTDLLTGAWSGGAGWTPGPDGGSAAAGSASSLRQPITVADGQVLRIALTVSGMTAGTLTPQLAGSATVLGAAITADGRHYMELTAAGTAEVALEKDAAWDGTVSEVSLYIRSGTSAPQGAWDYWAEPQVDGLYADAAGPITTEIS